MEEVSKVSANIFARDRVISDAESDVAKRSEKYRLGVIKRLAIGLFVIFLYTALKAVQNKPLVTLPEKFWLYFSLIVGLLTFFIVFFYVLPDKLHSLSPTKRLAPEEIKVTLDDIKGQDMAVAEARQCVNLMRANTQYLAIVGEALANNLLLVGPPGTGKTMLSQALAKESGVPFHLVTATQFVSMWQGKTAGIVRTVWRIIEKDADRHGGAVLCIDELDAIGGERGQGTNYSADSGNYSSFTGRGDQSQGINELLGRMDGTVADNSRSRKVKRWLNVYLPKEMRLKLKPIERANLMIIGMTNRPDALDGALVREGRFGKSIYMGMPALEGRVAVIEACLKKVTLPHPEITVERQMELARITSGMSPADLKYLINYAVALALSEGRGELTWADLLSTRQIKTVGMPNSRKNSKKDREVVAVHEAGHGVASYLYRKEEMKRELLSIINRGESLGLLLESDAEDNLIRMKYEYENDIRVLVASTCAEELAFKGQFSSGNAADRIQATKVICSMLAVFDMGEKTRLSAAAISGSSYIGNDIVQRVWNDTEMRAEAESLLDKFKREVKADLKKNWHLVKALSKALLEKEELDGPEIEKILKTAHTKHSK